MTLRAALFWDIDLTLLTTARAGIFALEDAVGEVCGIATALQDLRTAGMTDWAVAGLVLEAAGQEATPERREQLLRAYEQRLPESLHRRRGAVLPNVREVLEDLAARDEVRSFLLTGNTAAGARAKLCHYGLDRFFPDGAGAFCIGAEPRADIARRASVLADGADALHVIGDSPADVACGKAIGARTIAVASGTHTEAELAVEEPWAVLERIPPPDEFRALIGLA